MSVPSSRLSQLRSVFARRADKGLESWPVTEYRRGDCAAIAELLRELEEYRKWFAGDEQQ